MATFDDLGIPFPLFAAPIDAASGYEGSVTCRLCQVGGRHCFNVSALIVPCPACGAKNGLDVGRRADRACRACGSAVPFPERLRTKKQMLVCYDCLRAGKAAMSKSTELGAVGPEHAFTGVTDGVPGLRTDQFELVAIDFGPGPWADDDQPWIGARVPAEHLWELLWTPDICNWQEERWLFCCRQPMIFIGDWEATLARVQPADPAAFFVGLFEEGDWMPEVEDGDEPFLGEGSSYSIYIYECQACGHHRSTTDSD